LLADALAQLFVDGGDAGFTVEFDKGVAFRHEFELTFNHGLITNEGPIEVVRKRHVASSFPVTDGLGFFEFAGEGGFRANVEPKSEIGAESHGVESGEVIAIDATNNAASNEGEDETVGEDDGAGTERGNDAMFELVEEVGGIHEREGKAGNRVFGEKFVNIAADEIGAAETAGLDSEAFGFQPFLKKGDLRGAAGTVEALDDDEIAVKFRGIEADKVLAEKELVVGSVGGTGFGDLDDGKRFVLVLVGHHYSNTSARGANRFRSILEATMSRICFWSLLTWRVPSRTTKLSVSTILSYSSRMRA